MKADMMNMHQMVYLALFLAVAALILGGLGTKAYYDVEHNDNEDQTVGSLTVKNAFNVDNNLSVGGNLIYKAVKQPVENGNADVTLTEAAHAGTIVMQTDVSADRTYTIPDPSRAGVTYRLVGQGTGSAVDGHDVIFNTDGSVFYDGAITYFDTDTGGDGTCVIWANGTTHDRLHINTPGHYDITLMAKNTSIFYVTGTVTASTAPAFSAP